MKYLDVLAILSPDYVRELDSLTVVTAAYLLERKLYEADHAERESILIHDHARKQRGQPMS